MNKKNSYINSKAEKEIKAMRWFNKKADTSYVSQEDPYSVYDGILTSGSTEFITEVKVREKYSYTQIESLGGDYLEWTKYNGILSRKMEENDNRPILYVVFLSDRVNVYQLPVQPELFQWEPKFLNNNNYDKKNKYKIVTKLTNKQIIKTIHYGTKF